MSPAIQKKIIDPLKAAQLIRSGADHASLLRLYNLNLNGLRSLYRKLIAKDFIRETEVEMPSNKTLLHIRNQFTGAIIYSNNSFDIKELVRAAAQDNCDLAEADLARANLFSLEAPGVKISEALLIGANLRHAKLRGAELFRSELTRCRLDYADLSGADLTDANLSKAHMTHATFNKGVACRTNFDESSLSETTFENADLSEARFLNAVLVRADLTGANLSGAVLKGADLTGAVIKNANLEHIDATQIKGLDI